MDRHPLYNTMQVLLDDSDKSTMNAPTRSYVNDTKAMAGTAVDVKELPKSYVFVADMPGLKSSDVKVGIELPCPGLFRSTHVSSKGTVSFHLCCNLQVQIENSNVLVLSGERKQEEKHDEDVKYLRVERRNNKFMRKFTLPNNANLDAISAVCVDGVLTVTVPKLPPPEPHKTRVISVSG